MDYPDSLRLMSSIFPRTMVECVTNMSMTTMNHSNSRQNRRLRSVESTVDINRVVTVDDKSIRQEEDWLVDQKYTRRNTSGDLYRPHRWKGNRTSDVLYHLGL